MKNNVNAQKSKQGMIENLIMESHNFSGEEKSLLMEDISSVKYDKNLYDCLDKVVSILSKITKKDYLNGILSSLTLSYSKTKKKNGEHERFIDSLFYICSSFNMFEKSLYSQSKKHIALGDYVQLEDNSTIFKVDSLINDDVKLIPFCNEANFKIYSKKELYSKIDINSMGLLSLLNTPINLCNSEKINDMMYSLVQLVSQNINDVNVKSKFMYSIFSKILSKDLVTNESLSEFINSTYNSFQFEKRVIVGERCYYIGSYVTLKKNPEMIDLQIESINEDVVTISNKFNKNIFSNSFNIEDFRNNVFLLSDIYEDISDLDKLVAGYKKEYLSLYISEGVFDVSRYFLFGDNIKTDFISLVESRCACIENKKLKHEYLNKSKQALESFNPIQPLGHVTTIDMLDGLYESVKSTICSFNINNKDFSIDDTIAIKGFGGIKCFKITSMSEDSVILTNIDESSNVTVKQFDSINQLKLNAWKSEDIKHIKGKYLKELSDLHFEKICDIRNILLNVGCNFKSKSDLTMIRKMLEKVDFELNGRIELYACLLNRVDCMDFITQVIEEDQSLLNMNNLEVSKEEFIDYIKTLDVNIECTYNGFKVGNISKSGKVLKFTTIKGISFDFTYREICDELIRAGILTPASSVTTSVMPTNEIQISQETEIPSEEEVSVNQSCLSEFIDKVANIQSREDILNSLSEYIYSLNFDILSNLNCSMSKINKTILFRQLELGDADASVISIDYDKAKIQLNITDKSKFKFPLSSLIKKLQEINLERVNNYSFFDLV